MRGAVAVLVVGLLAGVAHAAEWDTIRPGESTQAAVRAQFGAPTRQAGQKVEGYDTSQWIYEGGQAPRGVARLTVDFGLLTPQGYRPDVVRVLKLQPKPGIFTRKTVLDGWGEPQAITTEHGVPSVFYQSGLIVNFDKDGWVVTLMVFTPPQPQAGTSAPKKP